MRGATRLSVELGMLTFGAILSLGALLALGYAGVMFMRLFDATREQRDAMFTTASGIGIGGAAALVLAALVAGIGAALYVRGRAAGARWPSTADEDAPATA